MTDIYHTGVPHRGVWVLLLALFLPLCAARSAIGADDPARRFEIGAYGGMGIPDAYGAHDTRIGPLIGGRLGYSLSPSIGLEASGQRIFSKWNGILGPAGNVFEQRTRYPADFDAFRLSGLWRFDRPSRIDPFLAAGAGLERTRIGPFQGSDFGLHAGAGIRWRFAPSWALRLDGRLVSVFLRQPVNSTQYNAEFTAGISLIPGPGEAREETKVPATPPPAPVPPPAVQAEPIPATPPAPVIPIPPPAIPVMPPRPAVALKILHFDTAKSTIRPADIPLLETLMSQLEEDPGLRLAIEGHADSRGRAAYNQALSERRARSVLQYFLDRGQKRSRFEVRGFGEMRPIAPNTTPEGLQANRRVEVRPL